MNEALRLKWQLIRLTILIPIAVLLILYTGKTEGWPWTWAMLRYFTVNISLLVILTKKANLWR